MSPPPITTSGLSRNTGSAPSQTAHAEIPFCHSRSVPGTSSRLAVAPVAMMSVRARTLSSSANTVNGRSLRSTRSTVTVSMRAPQFTDCWR